jgi:fido (protein-threonine AMPylation protein)
MFCRNCGEKGHLSIRCPLKRPEDRAKPWKEQVDAFDVAQEAMTFHCTVPMHPGKNAVVHANSVDEFWLDIRAAYNHSLYMDYEGIMKDSAVLVPPEHPDVEPGTYKFVSRTLDLTNEQLYHLLDEGVDKLRKQQPLAKAIVERVDNELLLQFTHFSLSHEGNSLGLDATRKLATLLVGKDSKRLVEDVELQDKIAKIPGTRDDLTEAVNHILVSDLLEQIANNQEVTETLVLKLHSMVMKDLLHNVEEGLPGAYRKVSIGVHGSSVPRALAADVPPLMSAWNASLVQKENEHIIDFLSRIHTKFQGIHPFRDGNGRIGRLIMNLLLFKQGYPVLVFPCTMSNMFNHGVDMGTKGTLELFSRLLAESIFASLQAYEDALGVQLLPRIEDIMEMEVEKLGSV